jgi:hypothetical protein
MVRWARADFEASDELAAVAEIATALHQHLLLPGTQMLMEQANQPGVSSAVVQSVLLQKTEELGFRSEAKGLFAGYPTSALRPDYYRPLPQWSSGILLEVEPRQDGHQQYGSAGFLEVPYL